jgi:hypothetical protein
MATNMDRLRSSHIDIATRFLQRFAALLDERIRRDYWCSNDGTVDQFFEGEREGEFNRHDFDDRSASLQDSALPS